jgi:enterochelin esterase-like enzyme
MNKLILFTLIVASFSSKTFAQFIELDNVIGKKYIIKSDVLNEDRTIQVYTPESYITSTNKKYPVLYILDGQRLFLHGVSVIQSFTAQFNLSPDIIVVGINNKYPDRFNHFLGTDFLDFIEEELITYIDAKYQTSDERLIFGWEYGGAFVIGSIIDRPHLFDAHIAASPYPIHEDRFDGTSRIDMLKEKLEQPFSSFVYFTVSANEGMVEDGTNQLEALLKNKAPKTLQWDYRVIEGAEHRATAYPGLYHGLRSYYHNYPELQFKDLADFKARGGMEFVNEYYKGRTKRFGFSEDLTPWSMFALTRNAIRADSFADFELFMAEFKDKDMLNRIRLSRAMSLATYYIKYNKFKNALNVYQELNKKDASSALLQNAIGYVYILLKDNANAKVYYEKAVGLAQSQKDSKLIEYQKDLDEM